MIRLLFVMIMLLIMTIIINILAVIARRADPDDMANATCKALFVLTPCQIHILYMIAFFDILGGYKKPSALNPIEDTIFLFSIPLYNLATETEFRGGDKTAQNHRSCSHPVRSAAIKSSYAMREMALGILYRSFLKKEARNNPTDT